MQNSKNHSEILNINKNTDFFNFASTVSITFKQFMDGKHTYLPVDW